MKLTCRALEVSPIGRASGRCRVRGRVHVLRSVTENPGLGAILKRTRTRVEEVQRTPDFADPGATTSHTVIDELATCGRFAVVDDSGVAVVDEDAFELWVSPGVAVPWNKACALMVRDGDEVEVIGPTRRELVSDAARLFSAVDYRSDAHHALVFDGTAKDRVLILATTCTLPS